MKEKMPRIFQFSDILMTEFHQLMNSKEKFLKQPSLLNADRYRLITLYEQLESAWSQNHSEKMMIYLEKKSEELREIQKQIKSNCESFKIVTKLKLEKNLVVMRKLSEEIEMSRLEDIEKWKKDLELYKTNILEEEQNLKNYEMDMNLQSQKRLEETLTKLIELEIAGKILEELPKLEMKLSSNMQMKRKELMNNLTMIEEKLYSDLEDMKKSLDKELVQNRTKLMDLQKNISRY